MSIHKIKNVRLENLIVIVFWSELIMVRFEMRRHFGSISHCCSTLKQHPPKDSNLSLQNLFSLPFNSELTELLIKQVPNINLVLVLALISKNPMKNRVILKKTKRTKSV